MPRRAINLKPNHFMGIIKESGQARSKAEDGSSDLAESGRLAGRRSRSGFTQVAGYVPVNLYKEVKRKLIDEDHNFSELLETWMKAYVGNQKAS